MRKRTLLSRVLLLVLTLVLVLGLVPSTSAAKVTKETKSYEIAVVFDNSGSIYAGGNGPAWCQAKYVMEVFASMLNYENGDKMTIFPMWEVMITDNPPAQTDSDLKCETVPNLAEEKDAIKITSVKDIQKIRNMYTPSAGGTPIETAETARKYIGGSNADEKWLVILTDGKFQRDGRDIENKTEVQNDLYALADDEVKVQYFAFNQNANNADSFQPSGNFFSKGEVITNRPDLEKEVIEACNKIFDRDVLAGKYLSGNTLSLPFSMDKLIVFAQGGADVTLKNSSGVISSTADSGQLKYSEISTGCIYDTSGKYTFETFRPVVDTDLAGRVVTYTDLEVGTYTIECGENVQFFYEPGVTMQVTLTDPDGNPVTFDPKEDEVEMEAGKYAVKVALVDKITGEDVTNSESMQPVSFDIYATVNDQQQKIENGGTLVLEPDSKVKVDIEGKYLEDYKIRNDEDSNIFPGKIVVPPANPLKIKATVEQVSSWYTLMEHESWKPIRVDMKVGNDKLTDEQLNQVEFKVEQTKGEAISYRYEKLPGQSAINVYVGQDESGKYVKPATGECELKFTATLTPPVGSPLTDDDRVDFTIQGLPLWVIWAIGLGIFAFVLAIFLLIMSQKVLPKKMVVENVGFFVKGKKIGGASVSSYDAKSRRITLKSIPVAGDMNAECAATFSLYPLDNRWTPSKRRRIGFRDITGASMGVIRVEIDGSIYNKKDGKFVTVGDEAPVDEKSNDPVLIISTRKSHLDVTFRRL